MGGFDTRKADSQGTSIEPIDIRCFDIPRYIDYVQRLEHRCSTFSNCSEGVAVYRRFRVPEVFSWGCADMKQSLSWQLAALKKSMEYPADIPNFLEPWYGIGVAASSFGIPYCWEPNQAPAVHPRFATAREAMNNLQGPVAESPVGRHVLEMIEYFLDSTNGNIPMSFTDTQSPLNIVSSYIMKTESFMYEMYDNPDDVKKLLNLVADLAADFLKKQQELIGDALVLPGHGFASSRAFPGVGFSDDNVLMISDDQYKEFAVPALQSAAGSKFPVFHSCGNWSRRSNLIISIPGISMADGAVGDLTDPDPNDGAVLGEAFAETGITLHARIVGSAEAVEKQIQKIWRPGLKLIAVTYCSSSDEQKTAYNAVHKICS